MDFTSATFSRINGHFIPKVLERGETWFAVELSKMHTFICSLKKLFLSLIGND